MQLYFLLLQSTDTFFLISHRYKLSICSVHAMSILFMLAQATAYNLFKLDDDSINDKLTFGDKRKPSNLLSLFLCFANLWLQSYIIIVFFIIVTIIIIIIIVVNNSLPKSSTSSFLYLLLMKLGSNISSISETLSRFQSTLNSVWIDRNMNKWKLY